MNNKVKLLISFDNYNDDVKDDCIYPGSVTLHWGCNTVHTPSLSKALEVIKRLNFNFDYVVDSVEFVNFNQAKISLDSLKL